MLVDAKVGRRIQTAVARIVKWLCHRRVFHEDSTIERGATLGEMGKRQIAGVLAPRSIVRIQNNKKMPYNAHSMNSPGHH